MRLVFDVTVEVVRGALLHDDNDGMPSFQHQQLLPAACDSSALADIKEVWVALVAGGAGVEARGRQAACVGEGVRGRVNDVIASEPGADGRSNCERAP